MIDTPLVLICAFLLFGVLYSAACILEHGRHTATIRRRCAREAGCNCRYCSPFADRRHDAECDLHDPNPKEL